MTNVIAITGCSGSGKSTLAESLRKEYPEEITIVHLDDYQKRKSQLRLLHGFPNFESPEAVEFNRLQYDIQALKDEKQVPIMTWRENIYPESEEKKLYCLLQPNPIIIIEGYLALVNEEVRKLYNYSIFLDLPVEESIERRTKFKQAEYIEKVLVPMYEKHILPTREIADYVIDASQSAGQVLEKVKEKINSFLLSDQQ